MPSNVKLLNIMYLTYIFNSDSYNLLCVAIQLWVAINSYLGSPTHKFYI